jgi:hypothetical protein
MGLNEIMSKNMYMLINFFGVGEKDNNFGEKKYSFGVSGQLVHLEKGV